MAWTLYDNFRLRMMNGNAVNFTTGGDTIKIAVTTATYTPNAATHDFFDDITNEVTGTNYTAGGAALASKTLNLASGTVTFDAADQTILQNAGGFTTGRRLIMYVDTAGAASTDPLIAFHSEASDFGNVAGDLTFQWDALGILTSP